MTEYRYVTQSELRKFKSCPLAWKLAYMDKLAHPAGPVTLKRDRGTKWHKMLEVRYLAMKEGLDPDSPETLARVLAVMNEMLPGSDASSRDEFLLLKWMYEGYCEEWDKTDYDYEILDAEQVFEIPMPVQGAPNLVITGKIDLVTRDLSGRMEIWDHKSVGGRDVSKDGFQNEMILEDQFPLYMAAKRIQGDPVEAVIYDAARTDKLKRAMLQSERFNRVSIPYTDAALHTVWEDNRMAAQALVRAYETGGIDIYSVPNARSCSWACDFYRVHIEGRTTGRDYVEIARGYGFVDAVDRYPDANGGVPVETDDDEW